MIPYLLAAIGGYFIGESQKKETEKLEAPQMAKGGKLDSVIDNIVSNVLKEIDKAENSAEDFQYLINGVVKKLQKFSKKDDGGMMEDGGQEPEYAKGGKIAEESGLKITKRGKKSSVSGKPNPYFFGEENKFNDYSGGGGYAGWWKSPDNFSMRKFEELVQSKIPTDDVKFDGEYSMFYVEGTDERIKKFYRDLIDSATMNYPSEFPFKTQKDYFNWESKRFREAKKKIGTSLEKEAIDEFYFEMFNNYGEKSVKNQLKKFFAKVNRAEVEEITQNDVIEMTADIFNNVSGFNPEVFDTEPENNIIFFVSEKLRKSGFPRRYFEDLEDDVRQYIG